MLKSRRQFLALARDAGGIALTNGFIARGARASVAQRQILNPMTLERFVDAMPVAPVLQAVGSRPDPKNHRIKLPLYRVEMSEFETRLHRDLHPTRQWGYGGSVPGPCFETRSSRGLFVEWVNKLPKKHFLPVDHTLHGAEAHKPEVRTVTHVHGARTPPESDGYPENWYPSGESRLVHYPNEQDAAALWYHDHAMGITRLNIFAGLFGMFIIRDDTEDAFNLPKGSFELPIVIYDRSLDQDGQLLYPVSATPGAPFVSEFYGNAVLCNGKLYPYFEVQPRKYRIRLLNAANGRFFHLTLADNRTFLQIGTDSGLLPAPLEMNSLVLFPAERADLIIDFAGLEGQKVQLRHEAEAILQFNVAATGAAGATADPGAPNASHHPIPATLRPVPRIPPSDAAQERILSLSEHDDPSGNSMQMLLNETHWSMPVTEKPVLGTTEIWSFVNLSGDAHPIHLHLVRFQVLDRRPFDLFAYNRDKKLLYTGPAVPPDANELGWKDTVRCDPGMVTRIIVKFEGFAGRYVWHCHTLEHEDNEMMRPYDVISAMAQ